MPFAYRANIQLPPPERIKPDLPVYKQPKRGRPKKSQEGIDGQNCKRCGYRETPPGFKTCDH